MYTFYGVKLPSYCRKIFFFVTKDIKFHLLTGTKGEEVEEYLEHYQGISQEGAATVDGSCLVSTF